LKGIANQLLSNQIDVIRDHNHLQFKEKEKIRVLRKEESGFEKRRINFGFTPLTPRTSHSKLKSKISKIFNF